MTRLVLPSWDEHAGMRPLELSDFVPRVARPSDSGGQDWKLRGLSILLSRSYLPLVAQIFRSMPRHLNDRAELAVLVDGINRISVTHGGDIGIVSQALIGEYLFILDAWFLTVSQHLWSPAPASIGCSSLEEATRYSCPPL